MILIIMILLIMKVMKVMKIIIIILLIIIINININDDMCENNESNDNNVCINVYV